MYDSFGIFIDGNWHRDTTEHIAVIDPATEESIGTVPSSDSFHLDAALAAAERGLRSWRAVPAWERGRILHCAAALVRHRAEQIANLMSIESGKPIAEARAETQAAADQFEWYAEEARRIYGQTLDGRQPDIRLHVRYEPVGIVAAFSAWNFPALLPARKLAAALAAGCSIIIKPASETPGSCMALVQALHDAGVAPGAVELITGKSEFIAAHLIGDARVRKISLTGSTPVGKRLLAQAAEGVKKVSMELGGHAPVLVFPDVDAKAAGEMAARAKFRNTGQVCISPSRFYVHQDVVRPFTESFVNIARQLKLGRGTEPSTEMGPMANARGLKNAEALVDDALARGARLEAGGKRSEEFNRGFFFQPTVLSDVPDDARIMHDEPFAPVAPITTFSDFDEVVRRANALPFGLAAYVFARSLETANLAAEALDAGMVGVNDMALATAEAPFGGVKESGMGREGGSLGIHDYLEAKYIRFRLA